MLSRCMDCRSGLRILVTVLVLMLLLPPVHSQVRQQRKFSVAVLDFDARAGLSAGEAASLSDIFQGALVESGEFIVVDRNRIKAILQEQGFQQSEACSQVECIVEAGRILKVEKMFAGTIGKIGRMFTVNVQVIDVATAQILDTRQRQHLGEIEILASDVVPSIAAEMIEKLTGRKVSTKTSSVGTGTNWLLYIGGAVLIGGGAAAYVLLTKSKESSNGAAKIEPLPDPPTLP